MIAIWRLASRAIAGSASISGPPHHLDGSQSRLDHRNAFRPGSVSTSKRSHLRRADPEISIPADAWNGYLPIGSQVAPTSMQ